jgi:hypothetical protein
MVLAIRSHLPGEAPLRAIILCYFGTFVTTWYEHQRPKDHKSQNRSMDFCINVVGCRFRTSQGQVCNSLGANTRLKSI